MTFNELVAWIVTKPFGRIFIERDERHRRIRIFLSCQAIVSGKPQTFAIEQDVPLQKLNDLDSKEAIEATIMMKFDAIKEDFEEIVKQPKEKTS